MKRKGEGKTGTEPEDSQKAPETTGDALDSRIRGLDGLIGMLRPVPDTWLPRAKNGRSVGGANGPLGNPGESKSLEPVECRDYATLLDAMRRAMKWTDGLEHGMTAILACSLSTCLIGEQIWLKLIGPASSGKTTLCEAMSVAKDWVKALSTMRGFHSGVSDESGQDYSLIPQIRNKTLVIKDADTLMNSPNLEQVLSEARDLYDTTSRTSYRTKQGGREHLGVRMSFILCGTSALRALDRTELGARFLDCVIMEGIDSELERGIVKRVVHRTVRNMFIRAEEDDPTTQQSPEMIRAMQLTGGYVCHLREHDSELMRPIVESMDDKEHILDLFGEFGEFVAYMRARPSVKQDENPERELAPRISIQLTRHAMCAAVVLNRSTVDKPVIDHVRRIALDTARGKTLNIARILYHAAMTPEMGLEVKTIADKLVQDEGPTRKLLRFMRDIKITQTFAFEVQGHKPRAKWKLTPEFIALYREVCENK